MGASYLRQQLRGGVLRVLGLDPLIARELINPSALPAIQSPLIFGAV